jgi:hypothetical protein
MKILIAILLGVLLMALGASGWRSNTGSGLFYLGGVIIGTGALLALSYRMNSSRQDSRCSILTILRGSVSITRMEWHRAFPGRGA